MRERSAMSGDGRARAGAATAIISENGPGASAALVFLLVMLIPNQLALSIGGVLLTPTRLIMMAMFVPILAEMAKGAHGRLRSFDLLFVSFSLWTCLCVMLNYPVGTAIQRAGQFFLETAVVYLMVQVYLRRVSQLMFLIRVNFIAICCLGLIAATETFGRAYWLTNAVNAVVGQPPVLYSISGERAGGLFRAATVFSHPILYGTYAASSLAMLWMAQRRTAAQAFIFVAIAFATMMALSSAPLLVLVLQAGMIGYERVSRGVPRRALLAVGGAAAILTVLELGTNRGAFGVLTIFTFNPETSWTRYNQWIYGVNNVKNSPLFGIEVENWARAWWLHPSIDNYWLYQAMHGGLPSVIFLCAAIVLIARRLFRDPDALVPDVIARLRRGWGFITLALVLCGATVHFFDKLQPFFAFTIALGAAMIRMLETEEQAALAEAGGDARRRPAATLSPGRGAPSPAT